MNIDHFHIHSGSRRDLVDATKVLSKHRRDERRLLDDTCAPDIQYLIAAFDSGLAFDKPDGESYNPLVTSACSVSVHDGEGPGSELRWMCCGVHFDRVVLCDC